MNRLEWIALAWRGQVGPVGFRRLLACFGSPRAAMEASPEQLRAAGARLSAVQIERIRAALADLSKVEQERRELEAEGVTVVCSFETAYPAVLAQLPTAPPVLSIWGRLPATHEAAVAIVGTRSPTDQGARLAEALAIEFAERGLVVVSGLARGIDTHAHRGALAGGGRTVAVLGSGIRVIHPPENRALAAEIAGQGALVSELSPDARPTVAGLMARNRLQSALSKGVIVVESQERGGSLQTAADARRQDRLLFVVDWPEAGPTTAGTRRLLREGALPIRGVQDVEVAATRLREHVPRLVPAVREEAGGQAPLF